MKKRILSYLVVAAMIITCLCSGIQIVAKQNFSVTEDFNDYVGSWNGTTVSTTAVLPSINNGKTSGNSAFDVCAGITSGIATDDKYGTSVKVYTNFCADHTYTQGMKYILDSSLKNSVYMETSMLVATNEDNSSPLRTITIVGKNEKGGGMTTAAVTMSGKKISAFGTDMGVTWDYEKWYDYKIWFNMDTGEYKVQTWNDGTLLKETQGINETLANLREMTGFIYYHNARVNHPTYMENKAPQTTYYDNLKIESIYKFHVEGTDTTKHAILDFETIDVSSKTAINSYNPKGNFWYGNSGNADGTTLEKVQTDRGYSLRLKPWVLDPEEYEWSYSNVTMEDGTTRKLGDVYDKEGKLLWARNTMLYPQVYFDFHKANHIYDAAYFKTGFKFEDANFGVFTLQVTNYYTPVSVAPNGSITVFGQDSGLDFAISDWFDVEGTIDLDTGYYTVKLSQEGNSYVYNGSGFVVPVDLTSGGGYTAIYRLRANYTNRAKANDWSMPTSILLDDMQLGPVSKLKGGISKNYTFEIAEDGDAFTTTGGTSVVNNGALNITGKADAETVTSMALPFVKTNFMYSADVTVGDMNADRTLIAQNQTAYNKGRIIEPVEIVKFGADGKLYVAGTAIENITVSTGTYNVNIIFNQANYSAEIDIYKDGEKVLQSNMALADTATKILTLEWKVGKAESITRLDNVEYNTVYDFEIIEKQSTHGEGYYITSADDVKVKFSNALNKTSFTADSVKVNGGTINVTGIEFEDDYTVKVNFDKNQGTYYMVEFTDVSDIYGNTINDYIEFDTVKQDLEMSAISFKKGDKVLSLVESGDINISFTAKANNRTSYDMLFMAGLYNGGKLVTSDFESFTVDEERKTHTLNITVPDDGKLYVLKGFVWNAETGAPYCEPAVLDAISADTKVALVKFDDFSTNYIDNFMRIAEWAEDNDVKMNFVFEVDYFDPDRESRVLCDEHDLENLKYLYENPYIELTSHSYTGPEIGGDTNFYSTATLEQQKTDFDKVTEVMAKQGITITSMAPPNNSVNADTRTALNANPQYKALMVRKSNDAELNKQGFFDKDNSFVTLWQYMDVEPTSGAGVPYFDVDGLKANWNAAMTKGYEYVLLQAHPRNKDISGDEFKSILDFLLWLKSQGVVFMHATEYAEYLSTL